MMATRNHMWDQIFWPRYKAFEPGVMHDGIPLLEVLGNELFGTGAHSHPFLSNLLMPGVRRVCWSCGAESRVDRRAIFLYLTGGAERPFTNPLSPAALYAGEAVCPGPKRCAGGNVSLNRRLEHMPRILVVAALPEVCALYTDMKMKANCLSSYADFY
jgi:hypothetical protein